MKKPLFLLTVLTLGVHAACAQLIDWVDWTGGVEATSGSAAGIFTSGITVSYTGEVYFLQDGVTSGGIYDTNFWTEGSPAPYTGNAVIGNAPTPREMVALQGSGIRNTITFSEAVWNPVMALVSVGQRPIPVDYAFNQNFNFLSQGEGYWNTVTGVPSSYSISGNTFTGTEFHGVIQFIGLVDEISWMNNPNETWHGFTVGAPVPEPSEIGLVALPLGIGLILFIRRKRRK